MNRKRLNINDFKKMKEKGEKITALTAYDCIFASILDDAGVDIVLVGDSLGNVFQGRETTIPVTMEEMIYHTEIVARTVRNSFVAVDMPFMSYQINPEKALENAGRFMKESGCSGVKLEGGVTVFNTIKKIVDSGIPVIGHVGFTPQSVYKFGGFGVQGKNNPQLILDDAVAVEQSGAFAVVVENVPHKLAAEITDKISIPTIGIGAGPNCDGQILVTPDILGLFRSYSPPFVKKYENLADRSLEAVRNYISEVKEGKFPASD